MRLDAGLRLAVTTFTVLPLRPGRVDRGAAATAMAAAPLIGALLGLALAGAAVVLRSAGAPALLAAALTVAAGTLLTRGLHLDGLADTADALGSYAGRDRALAIMRSPDVGPFGVAAVVLALLVQTASVAALLDRPAAAVVVGLTSATGAGRLAAAWACVRGIPAARPDGLGALVAGTVRWPVAAGWTAALATFAVPAVAGRAWQGPLAVLVGLGAAALLVRHAVRRLGGVTGDVLGAAVEVSTTVTLVILALS